jgi:c-di-GMP-related signal transduction protein
MMTVPDPHSAPELTLAEPAPLELFLGRQPILDRRENLVAYELLFRSSNDNASHVIDDLQATASVISRVFGEMDTRDVLGKHRGFINVSATLLMSDLIELLPRKQVVLELLETIAITDEIVQRCRSLKSAGYSLALDDFGQITEACVPLLDVVDIIKVDLTLHNGASLIQVVQALRQWPVQLLAEKVDSRAQADECLKLGFELFQGYFFAKPAILNGRGVDLATLPLLKLLGLIRNDAETDEIERIFRQSPNLTLNLLRLVNSVSSGVVTNIRSLRQAILVLGRKQLQRWIQLLLFTLYPADADYPTPLMHLAATRGRIMELLAQIISPNNRDYQDQAFMTGLLSLLDTLLGLPLRDVIRQLNISDLMRRALLDHEGELGKLLALVMALERVELQGVSTILTQLPALSADDLYRAELEAIAWVNDLN